MVAEVGRVAADGGRLVQTPFSPQRLVPKVLVDRSVVDWCTENHEGLRSQGEQCVPPPPYVLLPCHEESNRQTCGAIICFGARAPRNHDFFCGQYRGSQNFYFSVFFLVMDLHWQFGEVDIRAFSALSC